MSYEMSRKSKGGSVFSTNYGSTGQDDPDVFDPLHNIDTLRSSDESDAGMTCDECCKKAPHILYNLTLGACFDCNLGRQHKQLSSSQDDDMDARNMKKTLQYHFMNPFEKWNHPTKKQFPWKLVVQLLSIILVTTQLVLFANSKFTVTDFIHGNKKTFIQLFVINAAEPAFSNPLPSPIRVLYTNEELFQQLNHTAFQYFNLEEVAVGPYGYQWDLSEGTNHSIVPHLHLRIRRHESGAIDPTSLLYRVSPNIITDRYDILNTSDPIDDAVSWKQLQADLPGVADIHMDLTITSAYQLEHEKVAKCFQFNISFHIVNSHDKGIMPVDMNVVTKTRACDSSKKIITNMDAFVFTDVGSTTVDAIVMFISLISIIQCLGSLTYSVWLFKTIRSFFVQRFTWKLKVKHFWPLIDGWLVMITISNVMVIVGSVMKLIICYQNPDSTALVDATSIILGLAVFGQWCGLLRFLSYFETYNVLLITLKVAMPSVLRFGVCVGILYISFLLLGWLVLGPYHPKFRDTTVTSECLFGLINGDDVFNTYAEMSHTPTAIWIFSKIYIYVFVSLFIYIVLSVFIALISDTYETLNDQWRFRTRGLLRDFATDQLGRGRTRLNSHASHPSIAQDDAADYAFLRGAATGSEPVTQPPGSVQGSEPPEQPTPSTDTK